MDSCEEDRRSRPAADGFWSLPVLKTKAGDELPAIADAARVRRTDELYKSVRNGPSLRLVGDENDAVRMIRYGH